MYGTLIRNTGWTFQQCGEQPAAECFDFLAHLNEYPPDYIVLARHYGTGNPRKAASDAVVDPESMQFMSSVMGPTAPVPDDVRKLFEWSQGFGSSTVH